MRAFGSFFLGLILLVGWTAPTRGDLRLEIRAVEETEALSSGKKWVSEKHLIVQLGDGVARLDQGEEYSCFLHRTQARMFWVDHHDQTVISLGLPVQLHDLVRDSQLRTALKGLQQRQPEWLGKSQEKVQGYEADLHRWSLRGQDTVTISAWMVDLPDIDPKLYAALWQSCDFLKPQVSWLQPIYARPGIPYRLKFEREAQTFTKVETLEIIDILDFKSTPGNYRPPEAYKVVPFDAAKYLSLEGGGYVRP